MNRLLTRDPMTDRRARRVAFGVVIVGQTTLPIRCGEILLERGHSIRCVVSSDPQVVRWAEAGGIEHVARPDGLAAALARTPFDYLLSINNLSVLDEALLRLPRRWAINFHDGPLPGYPGLNAPAW